MIYVLDSEQDYIDGLKEKGIETKVGSLGYTIHKPRIVSLPLAPNEADAIVYNLTNPACYDSSSAERGTQKKICRSTIPK